MPNVRAGTVGANIRVIHHPVEKVFSPPRPAIPSLLNINVPAPIEEPMDIAGPSGNNPPPSPAHSVVWQLTDEERENMERIRAQVQGPIVPREYSPPRNPFIPHDRSNNNDNFRSPLNPRPRPRQNNPSRSDPRDNNRYRNRGGSESTGRDRESTTGRGSHIERARTAIFRGRSFARFVPYGAGPAPATANDIPVDNSDGTLFVNAAGNVLINVTGIRRITLEDSRHNAVDINIRPVENNVNAVVARRAPFQNAFPPGNPSFPLIHVTPNGNTHRVYNAESNLIEIRRDLNDPILVQAPIYVRNAMDRDRQNFTGSPRTSFLGTSPSSVHSSAAGSRRTSPVRERPLTVWFAPLIPDTRQFLYIPMYLRDQYSNDNLTTHCRPTHINPYTSLHEIRVGINFAQLEFFNPLHHRNGIDVADRFAGQFLDFSHGWSDWFLQKILIEIFEGLRRDGMRTFQVNELNVFKSHVLTVFLVQISRRAIEVRITPREYYYVMVRAEAAVSHYTAQFRTDPLFPNPELRAAPEPVRRNFPSTDNIMFP